MWNLNKLTSNYKIVNQNNLFNFILNSFDLLSNEDQKTMFMKILRLNLGMTITLQFKEYVFKKLPVSEIHKYL